MYGQRMLLAAFPHFSPCGRLLGPAAFSLGAVFLSLSVSISASRLALCLRPFRHPPLPGGPSAPAPSVQSAPPALGSASGSVPGSAAPSAPPGLGPLTPSRKSKHLIFFFAVNRFNVHLLVAQGQKRVTFQIIVVSGVSSGGKCGKSVEKI